MFDAEISPDEVKGMNSADLAEFIKSAYTAAEKIFEKYPVFKTIILDTFSVEETRIMMEAKNQIKEKSKQN